MYFPYLRGKQEEVLAVCEANFLSELVIPVFEPTRIDGTTLNRFERIGKGDRRFGLIVNSANGKPAPAMGSLIDAIEEIDRRVESAVIPALELRAGTETDTVRTFVARFSDRPCILVHRNHVRPLSDLASLLEGLEERPVHILLDGGAPLALVRGLSAAGRVLLRDGFKYHPRNADYPPRTNFDDLLYTYDNLGFDGFGDFSIVGDRYAPSGGPALHVALHLSELNGTTVVTNHFVSSTPPVKGNVQGKYFSALPQLIAHTGTPPAVGFDTQGVGEYHQSHANRHYPGLGPLKRWSMLHHFEIIDRHLRGSDSEPFI